MGSALRRCLLLAEHRVVPRITDLDAIYPAIAGKLEIEYGGEDKAAGPAFAKCKACHEDYRIEKE